MSSNGVAVGIDLGTCYCSVAVLQCGILKVLEDEHGNRRVPSYVAFTENEYLVGNTAKSQAIVNPMNTVYGAKRMLGNASDRGNARKEEKWRPFTVIHENSDNPKFHVHYKTKLEDFCPEEITALVLTKLKEMVQSHLGNDKVSDAVISVPASFKVSQRNAIVKAANIAGLKVLGLIKDTTAAALAYCTEKKITETRGILVLDFGGGSLDISLLSIENGVLQVIEEFGDSQLGGEDFDNNLLVCKKGEFQNGSETGVGEKRFLARLKNACTAVKHDLSKLPETRMEVEGCDESIRINRVDFEECSKDLFDRIKEIMTCVTSDEKIKLTKYDILLLVGGSTRIPKIEQLLNEKFKGIRISKGINRDEAVAYGAAVQAAKWKGDQTDVVNHIKEIKELTTEKFAIDQDFNAGEIEKMRQRAKELKEDSVEYHEIMKLRNDLEGLIITKQSELGKSDNKNPNDNENILKKCSEILDWLERYEDATKVQLESKLEELKTLKLESKSGDSVSNSLETAELKVAADDNGTERRDSQNADDSISPDPIEIQTQGESTLVREEYSVPAADTQGSDKDHNSHLGESHSVLESSIKVDIPDDNLVEDVQSLHARQDFNHDISQSKTSIPVDNPLSKEECQQIGLEENTEYKHGESQNVGDSDASSLRNEPSGQEMEYMAAIEQKRSSVAHDTGNPQSAANHSQNVDNSHVINLSNASSEAQIDNTAAMVQKRSSDAPVNDYAGKPEPEDNHCASDPTSGTASSTQAEEGKPLKLVPDTPECSQRSQMTEETKPDGRRETTYRTEIRTDAFQEDKQLAASAKANLQEKGILPKSPRGTNTKETFGQPANREIQSKNDSNAASTLVPNTSRPAPKTSTPSPKTWTPATKTNEGSMQIGAINKTATEKEASSTNTDHDNKSIMPKSEMSKPKINLVNSTNTDHGNKSSSPMADKSKMKSNQTKEAETQQPSQPNKDTAKNENTAFNSGVNTGKESVNDMTKKFGGRPTKSKDAESTNKPHSTSIKTLEHKEKDMKIEHADGTTIELEKKPPPPTPPVQERYRKVLESGTNTLEKL